MAVLSAAAAFGAIYAAYVSRIWPCRQFDMKQPARSWPHAPAAGVACAIGRIASSENGPPSYCTLDLLRHRPLKAVSQSRIVYAIAAAMTVTTVHAFSDPGWGMMAGAG